MIKRILTGTAILVATVVVLWFAWTPLYPTVWAALGVIGVWEFLRAFGFHRRPVYVVPSLSFAVAIPYVCYYLAEAWEGIFWIFVVLVIYLLWLMLIAVLLHPRVTMTEMAQVFLGVSYICLGFASMTLLYKLGCTKLNNAKRTDNPLNEGVVYVIPVFIGAWVTDTFAYFTGVLFGRHKLAPELSPKKTIEGSIGGLAFSMIAFILSGIIIGRITGRRPNYVVFPLAGLLMSLLSQVGDLFMSKIKREHGIKDYGRIFPGHGGVLDRFDSILPLGLLFLLFSHFEYFFSLFF